MATACLLATFAAAFLLGSVPNGVLVGRFVYHTDIRSTGSGNIGATNALRALGKKGGAAVFALDFGKGLLSGLVALALTAACAAGAAFPAAGDFTAAAFLGCVWGHVFSPWLRFKGGKGISAAIGCLFVTFGPLWALLELAVFAVVVAATRYVSAGSVAAAIACPLIALAVFFGDPFAIAACAVAAATVLWAHRGNISRLREGTERRIGGDAA